MGTDEEAHDRVDQHEDHHSQYRTFVDWFCRDSHQSGPDSQLHKTDREQVNRLVDKVDEHPVLVVVGWNVSAMSAGSVFGLDDRQSESDDCAGCSQSDERVLIFGVSTVILLGSSTSDSRPTQSCEAS